MMLRVKELVKFTVAGLLFYSGLLRLYRIGRVRMRRRSGSLILMYHRVLDDINAATVYTQPGMAVSTVVFDSQMSFLKQRYSVLPLVDLADRAESGGIFPDGAVTITFDDGWRDNYTPTTVFVTTDYVGTSRPFWFLTVKWLLTESNIAGEKMISLVDEVCQKQSPVVEPSERLLALLEDPPANVDDIIEELKQFEPDTLNAIIDNIMSASNLTLDHWDEVRPMMDWDETREMADRAVEIGSHGCSHRILTHLPDEEVKNELANSKRKLEQILDRPVTSFSYPNGDYDKFVRSSVVQAGYSCAVTTGGKANATDRPDRFALRRLAVHQAVSVGPSGKFSKAMFALHLTRHL